MGIDEANVEYFHDELMKIIKENSGMFGRLKFISCGMKEVGPCWASNWSFGEGRPSKQKFNEDDPRVKQLGTEKTIYDPKIKEYYVCRLTNISCKFTQGEPLKVIETWTAIGAAIGTPLPMADGDELLTFIEEHYMPEKL